MELLIIIISILVFYVIARTVYFNIKFKRNSKYPCYVVISQDGFMSNPMYYNDAKIYSDSIYGTIYVDGKEYNRLKFLESIKSE
jgi:hypothetical protein